MAAAYLDSQLDELLRAVFIDDQKVVGALLQSERPLGSFSAKIDMAYSLGLLPAEAYRHLHLIRKIRNEFGHRPEPITFNNPEISNRCRELIPTWFEREKQSRVGGLLTLLWPCLLISIPNCIELFDLPSHSSNKRMDQSGLQSSKLNSKVYSKRSSRGSNKCLRRLRQKKRLEGFLNEALFPQLFSVAAARADEPKQE